MILIKKKENNEINTYHGKVENKFVDKMKNNMKERKKRKKQPKN